KALRVFTQTTTIGGVRENARPGFYLKIIFLPVMKYLTGKYKFRASLFTLVVLFVLLFVFTKSVQASVTIVYFNASGGNDRVNLTWKTSSEDGNIGFYINRGNSASGPYERIPVLLPGASAPQDFIPSTGIPGVYQAADGNVQENTLYYYWLEAVDAQGNSQFWGPVSARPRLVSTSTATSTATTTVGPSPTATITPYVTRTPTPTATGPTATKTATRTPFPTRTATRRAQLTRTNTPTLPPAPTSTSRPFVTITYTASPSPTVTQTNTPTPTHTATLLPLPRLTLLFPILSPTSSPTASPTSTSAPGSGILGASPGGAPAQPKVGLLGGLIVGIWLLLGGFLFVYLRRINQ
ncbi:MAG: hypothetical protein ACM3PY_17495, partial [Omnitrophica WOR_2 bacterium]